MNQTNKTTNKAPFQSELNNLLKTVKAGRAKLEKQIKSHILDGQWVNDALKMAEKQGRDLKKMLGPDLARAKAFVERELSDLDKLQGKLQHKLPQEVKKMRSFINEQVKELEKAFKKVAVQAKAQKKSAATKSTSTSSAKTRATKGKAKRARSKKRTATK